MATSKVTDTTSNEFIGIRTGSTDEFYAKLIADAEIAPYNVTKTFKYDFINGPKGKYISLCAYVYKNLGCKLDRDSYPTEAEHFEVKRHIEKIVGEHLEDRIQIIKGDCDFGKCSFVYEKVRRPNPLLLFLKPFIYNKITKYYEDKNNTWKGQRRIPVSWMPDATSYQESIEYYTPSYYANKDIFDKNVSDDLTKEFADQGISVKVESNCDPIKNVCDFVVTFETVKKDSYVKKYDHKGCYADRSFDN